MISGDNPFKVNPTWNLGPLTMETVESLEILGVTYSSKPTNYTTHVNTRANKCRQAFFSLKDAGIMDKSLNSFATRSAIMHSARAPPYPRERLIALTRHTPLSHEAPNRAHPQQHHVGGFRFGFQEKYA